MDSRDWFRKSEEKCRFPKATASLDSLDACVSQEMFSGYFETALFISMDSTSSSNESLGTHCCIGGRGREIIIIDTVV